MTSPNGVSQGPGSPGRLQRPQASQRSQDGDVGFRDGDIGRREVEPQEKTHGKPIENGCF